MLKTSALQLTKSKRRQVVLEMTPNAGCVKPYMKQPLTLFLCVLNIFKKNANNNLTGWERLRIGISVERKALIFPRNDMKTNPYLVQKMSLIKLSATLTFKRAI